MPGPPPKKNARRRNARPDWVTLPAAGRKGKTPKWPLTGRAVPGWVALWRKPQAVMWERNGDEFLVARYAKVRHLVQNPDSPDEISTQALSELRQMEDRLGLSPMALKRLQWEIGEDTSVSLSSDSDSDFVDDGKVIQARERFGSL